VKYGCCFALRKFETHPDWDPTRSGPPFFSRHSLE